MTHYLRIRHDAICIGVNTAIADDPGLNSRLVTDSNVQLRQPRPIIIDPRLRWVPTPQSKVLSLAREGKGLAPYIVTQVAPPPHRRAVIEDVGGKFIELGARAGARFAWREVFEALGREGLRSVMVEGGGKVINALLSEDVALVDSVIVTIAPTWLGRGGVVVCPPRTAGAEAPVARLAGPVWIPLGEDVVLCGTIAK
ncbi:dihydrofolate reductase-like domain-containing protein [Xylaria nigripes]|nr:dihydrofolate reductase-like domain-containing protein [Xylaria nigripes]